MSHCRALRWVALGSVAGALVVVLVLRNFARVGEDTRARVRCHIRMLRTAVLMYADDTGSSPAAGLSRLDDPALVAARVMSRLYPVVEVRTMVAPGRRAYLTGYTDRVCILGLLDPWGRPYRIAVRGEPHGDGRSGCTTGIDVWSVGRNGVDEGGMGDDIVDPLWWSGPSPNR